MVDVVVFNILIPCTENATGLVHPPSKFDAWVLETADRFGGVTVVGLALQGLWFDPELPREANRSRISPRGSAHKPDRSRAAASSATI